MQISCKAPIKVQHVECQKVSSFLFVLCSFVFFFSPQDLDGDGMGDASDDDIDGDGVGNEQDT